MDKMVRAHLLIEGFVQGVSYRANTVEVARDNGVCGWVKNNPNGTVEAIIEGEESAVKKVIQWCHSGPPMARVDRVNVSWEPFKDEFDNFIALTRYNSY
ncbi:MAG: acylphosphatase [Deltaproteobacteria bacterium]|nr:acylphosphatase [Deltaproteobacteria bacterium]